MKDGRPYTYTVLRYVHDVMTAEFVNVGVILHVPSMGLVKARIRPSMGPRLRGVFPDLDRDAFTRTMRAVERSLQKLADEAKRDGLFASDGDAVAMACRALPKDDSSLQWSAPAGAGITSGKVGMWRGGWRLNISVATSFVWRCLSGSAVTPFPHSAHRTGQADLPHPALGQNFTPSPTARRVQAGPGVRARSAHRGARVDRSRPCVA